MAEVVTQEQYEQIKEYYREQKGYEDMSDDEKAEFDANLDKAMSDLYEVDESEGDDDQTDNAEMGEKKMELSENEMEKVKGDLRERYEYDDMYAKLDLFLMLGRITEEENVELTGMLVKPEKDTEGGNAADPDIEGPENSTTE